MRPGIRLFHRSLVFWLALPLCISLATGLTYRVGRTFFGMGKPTGKFVMDLHTGAWMGEWLSVVYVLFTGLGLLAMAGSGLTLLLSTRTKNRPRLFHRLLGALLLLPLTASAITGILHHLGIILFKMPEASQKLLMTIHEGSWLGPGLKPFYVISLGLGLLLMIATGLRFRLARRQ